MQNAGNSIAYDRSAYLWVGLFSVAFGFLEAIVVIYMRELYYPEGFSFPLVMASPKIYLSELIRELTTLIMLIAIGMLSGRNFIQRLAWFFYAFGVWDILFYVALKIFLDWPASLLTYDILFLIPVIWVGPVLAPLIVSLTMISTAMVVIEIERKGYQVLLNLYEWMLIIIGAIAIFISFIKDYTSILLQHGFSSLRSLTEESAVVQEILKYIPERFSWYLFIPGELLIFTAFLLLILRIRKSAGK
jgi:hypothetical protein